MRDNVATKVQTLLVGKMGVNIGLDSGNKNVLDATPGGTLQVYTARPNAAIFSHPIFLHPATDVSGAGCRASIHSGRWH